MLFELNPTLFDRFIEIDGGTHHDIREQKRYLIKLQEILERL